MAEEHTGRSEVPSPSSITDFAPAHAQVVSQITTTYQIRFPNSYREILSKIEAITVPVKVLPFGCTFPNNLDNFMFCCL
eukprot:5503731-Prymnesium_polylepis.1